MTSVILLDMSVTGSCFRVFFFQAEDGIRDWSVTGVQTCALPICEAQPAPVAQVELHGRRARPQVLGPQAGEIGRASCREKCGSPVEQVHNTNKKTSLFETKGDVSRLDERGDRVTVMITRVSRPCP